MRVTIYVEGGGDHNKHLQTLCRKAFSEFFGKAGLEQRKPRVVACGGRRQAYDKFRTSCAIGGSHSLAILLVDSEGPVTASSAWNHVSQRKGDQWECPPGVTTDQIQLMVQAMEAWLHADRTAVETYYGSGFRASALSQRQDIEISKADLFAGLKAATKDCQKGEYSKGEHSFRILALIDPTSVSASSPFARRLLELLDDRCSTA